MTHLQDIIKSLLDGIKDDGAVSTVILDTRPMTNVNISEATMPCAVCYCISNWKLDIRNMRRREIADINVLFVDRQPYYGFDGQDNTAIVQPLEDIAAVFVARLLAIPDVEVEGNEINARTLFDEFDTNVTGVQLTLRVRELQGECLTTEFPEP